MNKKQAISQANRLAKSTNSTHYIFKNLSGFEVVSDDFLHTAMGNLIYETN